MVMKPLLILLLAANTPQVTGETLRGQRKLQGLNAIAGYMPGSQVDDHNAIDRDQAVIEQQVALKTAAGLAAAQRVYTEGGFSKSFARLNLTAPLSTAVTSGTSINGVSATGPAVMGKALGDFAMGSSTIDVQYLNGGCYVGGLPSANVTTDNCLTESGSVTIATANGSAVAVVYNYVALVANNNGRTIQGFSTSADTKMLSCPIGCPYPDFKKFYDYYRVADYGDQWVTASFAGTATTFTRGNADFSNGRGNLIDLRVETIQKGTAYLIVWMYVLREFEDALDDCQDGCINCNDDPVHAWDEGVAFYTGSSHGTMAGTTDPGYFIYSLANKRCANFKTCGTTGDAITGNSKVNYDLFALFDTGRTQLQNGQCAAARITKNKVAQLMAIPATQGTLRYAYITGAQGTSTPKAIGEGAVFAAAVLPLVHACSPTDALLIYNNMQVNRAATDFAAVKAAFERNYECMGFTCQDVGGYYNKDASAYFNGATPCTDEPVSSIAGYMPGSQVTDHNAIDLDQRVIEEQLSMKNAAGLAAAKLVYDEGGYSKSYARVMLANPLNVELTKGTRVQGVSADGTLVRGKALLTTAMGSNSLDIQYETMGNQEMYVNCQVGGLPAANVTTVGCLDQNGVLSISGLGDNITYTYNPQVDNNNARTIRGFSTSAASKMLSCPVGCPYPDFKKFYDYYGVADYGDQWVTASFDGTSTSFTRGNGDFSNGRGNEIDLRVETIQKGTAYLIVWMYVIREFEDAIGDCQDGCINCNDDPVHAWDEGVAFYTGSSHGTMAGTTDPGFFIYSLANKRCANFKTCGTSGNSITGNAKVNYDLFGLFDAGRTQLQTGQCAAARITKNKVAQLMAIPATQGTLRYAYITGAQGTATPKAIGEGAVFAAAVLPLVHACSAADAQLIYDNMQVNRATTDFAVVKAAFERNYECMGITCQDVGGYFSDSTNLYFPGADPCVDEPLSTIAGYMPGSQVTDHNAIDLDQKAIEEQLGLKTNDGFTRAKRIYVQGGFSKSYARVMLSPSLPFQVEKGTKVDGVTADGAHVDAKVLIRTALGSSTIDLQYETKNNQALSTECHVGGLPPGSGSLMGCLAASGSITIDGVGSFTYTYDPNTANRNDRSIQGFSTSAASKMLNCPIGCPYPDFKKFYDYYGFADYGDKWVSASIDGTNAGLLNGNADFSSGQGNLVDLRVETAQKGTAYMIVWMYVLREFEDALDDCKSGCISCNDDPVHAWDEGVAFYTGSSHGTDLYTTQPGYLIYSLANKRCENFKTCGEGGDSTSGNSKVNRDLFRLFEQGKRSLQGGRCLAARNRKNKIAKIMAVPAIQGTIRYAYITGPGGNREPKAVGEGAVFAAAVLPIVHACSPSDAQIIYDNMNVASTSTNFGVVKSAFERNYACMGITCAQVGGYYDKALQEYFPGAAPCQDPAMTAITLDTTACFDGESTVQVQGVEEPVLIGNVKVGDYVLVDKDGKYDRVYSFGHYGPLEEAPFLSITTDVLDAPLKISDDHLVFVETASGRISVPGSKIVTGDRLVVADGQQQQQQVATVESIDYIKARGVYAPFTMSGTIVVNGVVASNYVTMQTQSETLVVGGWKTPLTYQWLGHTLQTPHRLLCRLRWSQCAGETHGEDGVSNMVKPAMNLAVWFLDQNAWVSSLLFVLGLLPLLALLVVLDLTVLNPLTVAGTVAALVLSSKVGLRITSANKLE